MIILEQYIALFEKMKPKGRTNIPLSLDEVASILFCTYRNARLIIKKMEELNWVQWTPGKGRGNRSSITFLVDARELVLQRAKELVKKGDLREAKKLITNFESIFPKLEEQFTSWFDSLFGYHTEIYNQQRTDILRLKVNLLPIARLDPLFVTLRSECHILKNLTDTLVKYNNKNNQIEPCLAFYWECNEDHKTWLFYIRKGVRFHGGTALTADDIVFTFKRFIAREDHPFHWMLSDVSEVVKVDDYIVQIKLYKSNKMLLHLLSDVHLSILHKTTSFDEKVLRNINGTGPFKLLANEETQLILEANDGYFKERPLIDRVELWDIPFNSSMNKNDILIGFYPKEATTFESKNRQQNQRLEMNVQYLSVNLAKNGPLQNLDFRMALSAIVDRKQMVFDLGGERDEVATSLLPRVAHTAETLDDDEIKLLLKNYNGEVLKLFTYKNLDHVEDSTWLVEKCKAYGINIEVTYLNPELLEEKETILAADLIHDSATIDEHIVLCYLHILLDRTSFIHNHLDKKIKDQLKTRINKLYEMEDEEERLGFLREIEGSLLAHYNVLPLYRNRVNVETDEMVQNINVNAQGWVDFQEIWFKK